MSTATLDSGSDGYRALLAVVALVVASAALGGVPAATAAVTTTTATATTATTTTATASSSPAAVYADGSDVLHVLYANGTTASLGVTAVIAGKAADYDDDGYMEVAYVNGSGYVNLVSMDGAVTTLAANAAASPIGVGDYDGDGIPAVFYESSDGKLYRVQADEGPETVAGLAANGALGVADYDGDGTPGVVYLGSSSTVKWYDGSTGSTGFSSFGTNNGYGIGAPAFLDAFGHVVVPIVKSNNVKILYANGTYDPVTSNYGKAAKSQLAAVDWRGDDSKELLHLNTDENEIYLAYQNGTVDPLTAADGSTIVAGTYVGVAGAAPSPAPEISEYSVTNPSGRNITVSFNSTEALEDISVDVDGPDPATLTEADFARSGDGPYRYEATYTAGEDGTYDATLTTAEGADGRDGATGQTGSVTIDTPAPTVTNVTLVDPTDDDGLVAGGDTIRVTATVNSSSTITRVTVDATAFGAGTVAMERVDGGYAANLTVDAAGAAADGSHDVSVTAVNEYDHRDTNSSGTLFLDTTPPAVDAGPNRTVDEDTDVLFDGSGTSDATRIVDYTWEFPDGTASSDVTVVHRFPDPGNYTVTLTATDAVGHTATDTVEVTVENVSTNHPEPTVTNVTLVDATDDDGIVTDGDTIRVTATVRHDATLTNVTATLSKFGAGTVVMTPDDGVYAATATVDAEDAAADGRHDVWVTATNEYDNADANTSTPLLLDTSPPAVDAGPNRTVAEGADVLFDASGTTDASGVVDYTWEFPDGTTSSQVTVVHRFPDPGNYTVTLTATDAVGHTATDTVEVTVENVDETTDGEDDVRVVTRVVEETTGSNQTSVVRATTVITRNAPGNDTTVVLRNVSAGVTVDVPLRKTATRTTELTKLAVTFQTPGAARINVSDYRRSPAGVPPLRAETAAVAEGYFGISHATTSENVSGATFVFSVDRARVGPEDPEDVALYRYHGGDWTELGAQFVGATADAYHYRAHSPGLSTFAVGVERGSLAVTAVNASPDPVRTGGTVVVTAAVANTGSDEATVAATVAVNDDVRDTRNVTVPADATRTVTFAVTLSDPGRYTLSVENETVTVQVEPSTGTGGRRGADVTAPESSLGTVFGHRIGGVNVLLALLVSSLAALETVRVWN